MSFMRLVSLSLRETPNLILPTAIFSRHSIQSEQLHTTLASDAHVRWSVVDKNEGTHEWTRVSRVTLRVSSPSHSVHSRWLLSSSVAIFDGMLERDRPCTALRVSSTWLDDIGCARHTILRFHYARSPAAGFGL